MKNSNESQERRVLKVLQEAKGSWINGNYFRLTMMLSQYHRAIFNLQNDRTKYSYSGRIEVSDFVDEYKFRSYRLIEDVSNTPKTTGGDGERPVLQSMFAPQPRMPG